MKSFINQNYVYPIVHIPAALTEIISRELEIPELPIYPKLPVVNSKSRIGLVIIFIATFVLAGTITTNSIEEQSAIYFLLILYIIGFISILIEYQKNKITEEKNSLNLKMYNYEIQNYIQIVKLREELILIQNNEDLLDKYLIGKKIDFFNSVTKPNIKVSSKKGLAENYFLSALSQYFPGKIFSDITISGYSTLLYVPDFIYADVERGLYIDIEIDEPYDIQDRKPLHLCDEDSSRNEFFISNNWIVIRFTERQIVCETVECCNFIASIIYKYGEDEKFINHFCIFPDINIEYAWTKSEAELMSETNEREKYLNKIGINVVKLEFKTEINNISKRNYLYEDKNNLPF